MKQYYFARLRELLRFINSYEIISGGLPVRLISFSRTHIICRLSRLPYYKVSNVYTRGRKGAWRECVTQCNEWPPFEALTSPLTLCTFSRERKAPGAVNLKHVICKVVMVPTVATITVDCLKYPSMRVRRFKGPASLCPSSSLKKEAHA